MAGPKKPAAKAAPAEPRYDRPAGNEAALAAAADGEWVAPGDYAALYRAYPVAPGAYFDGSTPSTVRGQASGDAEAALEDEE